MSWSGFIIVGANHRQASQALRDQIFVAETEVPAFLSSLTEKGLKESLVLSTCDRTEVWAITSKAQAAVQEITAAFALKAGIDTQALLTQLYVLQEEEAIKHAFAVASSLDSLIIGEPQVLAQVKDALNLAEKAGGGGAMLNGLGQAALACGKKVRTETSIGQRPISIAAALVQLVRGLFGEPANCTALLAGDGDMGGLMLEALNEAGLKGLTVTASNSERAEALSRHYNCRMAEIGSWPSLLAGADIAIFALNSREAVLSTPAVKEALKLRKRKPILLADAGIPGDIDPLVNNVDGAFLYDLNDLERQAQEGRTNREAAARKAWDIVALEAKNFMKGKAQRAAVPAIIDLRDNWETLRQQVLTETSDPERATQLLLGRILHAPQEELKALAAKGGEEWNLSEALLRKIFRLE